MRASQVSTIHIGDEPTAVTASSAETVRGGTDEDRTHPLPTRRTAAATIGEPSVVMGRYRLTKRLGSGAFGTVWSARDERLDRDVAVKLLPRERVIHARFEREARAAARLQHPAIVTLYEAAVDDEGAYLVSELVRGRTLDALLEQGKLSDREIVEIGLSLCDALAHAHSEGVIHRDVKPSNVLVPNRSSGSGDRAKLTDFGVAHVVGGATLTRTGDVIGTLAYMAPEQADGREAGPEADLYSLALVLYEALTGVNPQEYGAHARRGRSFVPPVRRQRRDLSRHLAAGIDQALRPRMSERGTLQDLRVTLLQSLDQADDTRGVVAAAWRGDREDDTWVREEPGPEWREAGPEAAPRMRVSEARGSNPAHPTGTAGAVGSLSWLPRAANAAGAGLGAAWLCTHLWHHAPVPPAGAGLVAAVVALVLPLIGSLLTAVALGAVSLAGAFPAVVAQIGGGWLRRALFGAAGFCVLICVSKLAHHNLYWLPAKLPPSHGRGLAAIGVWAAAAAVQPLLRTRRFPMFDVLLCAAWSAAVLVAVEATGALPVRGDLLGALAGTLIVAWKPLLMILEETRISAGIHSDVA